MIQKFLDYLRHERNLSQLTVDNYGKDLQMFKDYCETLEEPVTMESADSDVVRGWIETMMDDGHKATSVNRRLSALHCFYRFALKFQLVDKDPSHKITGPKKAKPVPSFVREKEMEKLLDDGMWNEDMFTDVRARTIIELFYNTGMRLAELISLDDGSVDFSLKQVKVAGKRNKQRIIPFGKRIEDMLRRYMAMRNDTVERESDALFVSDRGKRISRALVTKIVKENLSRITTLDKRSPHVLRHTFATAMLNDDAGIESVRKLLGHASLDTTEIYTHVTYEQLRAAYDKAHPRAETQY